MPCRRHDRLLSKPFDPFKLVETIEVQLSGGRTAPAPEPFEAWPRCPSRRRFVSASRSRAGCRPKMLAIVIDRPSLLKRCLGNGRAAEKLLVKFHARLGAELNEINDGRGRRDSAQFGTLCAPAEGGGRQPVGRAACAVSGELESSAAAATSARPATLWQDSNTKVGGSCTKCLPLVRRDAPERTDAVLAETVLSEKFHACLDCR